MKRFVAVLSSLLILPAFAEVMPPYYDDVIEMSDAEIMDENFVDEEYEDKSPTATIAGAVNRSSGRVASSRAVASSRSVGRSGAANGNTSGRNVSARSANVARSVSGRAVASRPGTSATRGASRNAASGRNVVGVTPRGAVSSNGANTARAVSVSNSGMKPLYNANAVRASVGVRASGLRMASASVGTASVSTSTATTTAAAATPVATVSADQVAASMDEIAQLTDYCKAQYVSCMDNFCNVLDDNQGRCSCSKNVKNYAKTEAALKQATEELQEVAQKIQYIGLSSDDIETLFSQTEAEIAMQSKQDSSQIKNDLDRVKKLIVDVKQGTVSSTESGLSMDLSGLLDFNIDNTGFDLSSFFGTNNNNTSSIGNQRGEQLYKTAAARCRAAVLNTCSAQGVDINVISNAYDMEIDKQCITYERSLIDANDKMSSTVRNAKGVLQKARLMVAQQKNQYDLRGCVNALDSCMQDDFVCGTDYENCLDPTGKYIVNGAIVVGSTPGESGGSWWKEPGASDDDKEVSCVHADTLYNAWEYKDKSHTASDGLKCKQNDETYNAWGKLSNLSNFIEATIIKDEKDFADVTKTNANLSALLHSKIGYHASDGRNVGMCISVLNKCQAYTYDKSGKYLIDNDVVREYLARTLVQIKNTQDTMLADYASNCVSDVTSCLTQNNFDPTKEKSLSYTSDGATNDTIQWPTNQMAVRACLSTITTCMSVNGVAGSASTIRMKADEWVKSITGTTRAYVNCAQYLKTAQTNDAAGDNSSCIESNGCKLMIVADGDPQTWKCVTVAEACASRDTKASCEGLHLTGTDTVDICSWNTTTSKCDSLY